MLQPSVRMQRVDASMWCAYSRGVRVIFSILKIRIFDPITIELLFFDEMNKHTGQFVAEMRI